MRQNTTLTHPYHLLYQPTAFPCIILSLPLFAHSLQFLSVEISQRPGSLPPFVSTLCLLLCCRRYTLPFLCNARKDASYPHAVLPLYRVLMHTLSSLVLPKHTTSFPLWTEQLRTPIAYRNPFSGFGSTSRGLFNSNSALTLSRAQRRRRPRSPDSRSAAVGPDCSRTPPFAPVQLLCAVAKPRHRSTRDSPHGPSHRRW